MNARAILMATAVLVVSSGVPGSTQAPPAQTVDGLVSAAKNAAGTDWAGTFLRLCVPPPFVVLLEESVGWLSPRAEVSRPGASPRIAHASSTR